MADCLTPLVTWLPARKRRRPAKSFMERHSPKPWHFALLIMFIVVNELRGVAVAAAFVKAYIAA